MNDLKSMVKEHLTTHGFDGLYWEGCGEHEGCGCTLDDFMPCDEPSPECMAGYKRDARDIGLNFTIGPKIEPRLDSDDDGEPD